MNRWKSIPSLGGVADKIAERIEIPPFPDKPDPETGSFRPPGWGMVDRATGRPLIAGRAKKKAAGGPRRLFGIIPF
jgi:hypothetical protein